MITDAYRVRWERAPSGALLRVSVVAQAGTVATYDDADGELSALLRRACERERRDPRDETLPSDEAVIAAVLDD